MTLKLIGAVVVVLIIVIGVNEIVSFLRRSANNSKNSEEK